MGAAPAGPHRGPDGEDSCADHASFELCDDDRRCGNEEQVAQIVDVVAPVCLAIARASLGLIELSGNTALTRSRRMSFESLATSPADGWACVVCDGMTAPTTAMP